MSSDVSSYSLHFGTVSILKRWNATSIARYIASSIASMHSEISTDYHRDESALLTYVANLDTSKSRYICKVTVV